MTDPLSDSDLDALLRGVPLPPQWTERLRAIGEWSDDELDRGLRQVEIPRRMIADLHALPDDAALDERLAESPLPDHWPEIAAVCRAVCENGEELDYVEEVAEDTSGERTVTTKIAPLHVPDAGPRWTVLGGLLALAVIVLAGGYYTATVQMPGWRDPDLWVSFDMDESDRCWNDPNCSDSELDLLALMATPETIRDLADVEDRPTPISLVSLELPGRSKAARQMEAVLDAPGLTKTKFELLFPEKFLGEPQRGEVPELREVAPLAARGVAVPLLRGYDRLFQWKHGVHPFVVPAINPQLAVSEVPLSTSTASFDALRQATTRGELPASEAIYVEDFLAALPSQFPPARPGMVELRTAAGPAVFAAQRPPFPDGSRVRLGDGLPRLLQVQVETGGIARRALPATYLTIAVDVSARMRWGGRLDDAQRAIAALASQLGPRDKIALVAMGEESTVLLSDAGRDDAERLHDALVGLVAHGPLNLSDGLRAAAHETLSPTLDTDVARRMVVITGGVERFDEATHARVEQLLASLAEQRVALDICDCSGYPSGHPMLAELAKAARANVTQVRTSDDIRWRLVESLTGSPATIAHDAVLRIRFNPQAVAGWRLIGNEAGPVAGLSPRAAETELRAGQVAMLLYEVWLHGSENDVATAEVAWRDAASGVARTATQPISRLQFASTWEESALPLQAAAIAAEAAEVLRGGYFASSRNRVLKPILEQAAQANRRLAAQPSFQEFVDVLFAAEEVRSGRARRGRE